MLFCSIWKKGAEQNDGKQEEKWQHKTAACFRLIWDENESRKAPISQPRFHEKQTWVMRWDLWNTLKEIRSMLTLTRNPDFHILSCRYLCNLCNEMRKCGEKTEMFVIRKTPPCRHSLHKDCTNHRNDPAEENGKIGEYIWLGKLKGCHNPGGNKPIKYARG